VDFLNNLYLPGALTLWCSLLFALFALWGYAQLLRGDESARPFARRAYLFFALSILVVAGVMIISLIRRDFRIEYVYQYSGMDLPTHYQFAAFWAGQKGSFLIWLVWAALLGLPLAWAAGKRDEAPVMAIYTLTALGLLFILVRENPFLMLSQAPADGKGLNPLLQDDWMVIHPPIMFIGYAMSAIPFSFAVAAMWRRDYSRWAARAFPWALIGFLILGTAILMGGFWAYKTLGWGGYWGWDPVENASLIPWLFGVVLIHGLHMERTRKRYRRANLVLACLVYMSVLYGTFLTRSGVLADFSVHSFVDLGISGWLIGLMAVFGLIALYLLATRLGGVPTEPNEDPLLSRGTFLVLSTITVLTAAILVTVGTSAPLLTRLAVNLGWAKNLGQVGPSFYNTVNFPIAVLVAFLLGVVPYLTWRSNPVGEVLRKMVPAAVVAVAATVVAAVVAVRDPFYLGFVFLATLALASNLYKTLLLARSGGLRVAGGYLAHVGVGVILLGILASSAYDQSTKVTLVQGVPQQVDDLTLTFNRFLPRGALPDKCSKECMEVEVARADGSRDLLYPKLFINDRTRQLMANPDIRWSPLQDLYLSPIEYDPGEAAGAGKSVELAKGESARVGDATVRFVDFDLDVEGDAHAQIARGGRVSVGAAVEVLRDGRTDRVTPIYRVLPDRQQFETPPAAIPGGGTIVLAGIVPAQGAVRLELSGLGGAHAGVPAKLSIDVTRKPLINLVWGGLFVVLAGGILATLNRLREVRRRQEIAAG
jgi:cytochrome c-type biogenesis protein CcmF